MAADTKEKLLEAAAEVFLANGPDATIEDIVERSGVSSGSLYHAFRNKQGLIEAVTGRIVSARADAVRAALANKPQTVRDAVDAIVRASVAWHDKHRAERAFLSRLPEGRVAQLLADGLREAIDGWAIHAMSVGQLGRVPLTLLHALIFGPVEADVPRQTGANAGNYPDIERLIGAIATSVAEAAPPAVQRKPRRETKRKANAGVPGGLF